MKMINFVLPVLLLFSGFGILAISSLFKSSVIPNWLFLLISFLFLNLIIAHFWGMWGELQLAWSYKKIPIFFTGFFFGLIPTLTVLAFLFFKNDFPQLNWSNLAFGSIFVTLSIVCWEELWFRGVPLELAAREYTKLWAAVVFGLLFFSLHFFNPAIDMLKHGLELFLAGYTLSLIYFLFDGIWAPIGMHFSNNILGALLKGENGNPIEENTLIYTLSLAILAMVFTIIYYRKNYS